MKYKLLIIILIGSLLTIGIYLHSDQEKMNILALGDGISTGMTPYHVEGFDYNDYLAEYLNEQNNLGNFYKNFNEVDETVNNLLNKIYNNIGSTSQKIKIKQAIKEADIITISLGMDELNNYAKKNLLGSTKITGFINKYEELLRVLTKLNNKKIFIISLYTSNLINQTKITKINEELKNLAVKYNINYVNIEEINENQEFFINKNNYYLNYKGQEAIFSKIKDILEQSTMCII